MPSSHLILCHPLLLPPSIFPSIKVFSSESVLHIKWPKFWSFSFSISPSSEYRGLISFRIDGLISLLSQGLSRVFSNTTVQKHQFFGGIPHSFNHCQVMLRTPSVLPHYAWMTAEGRNVMSLSTEGKRPQDLEGPRSDFRLLRSFWMWAKEYPVQRVIFQANSF